MRPKPVALVILDGWGIAPKGKGNAIAGANTPNFNKLVAAYPAMTLRASGDEVGLSWGEMGTSEVGHLNLGTGRIFYQTLPRINKAIGDGSFFRNKILREAAERVKKHKSNLHLMGLTSVGRVHTTIEHLYALLKFAKEQKIKNVFIHVFLDGRDTIYNSGIDFVKKLQEKIKEYGVGHIATLSGRFYAMDRDNRWDRTEKAYRAIAEGKSDEYFSDPVKAIESSYKNKVYDEEFVPVVILEKKKPVATFGENDAVIFFNYRADRARQMTKAFITENFYKFERTQFFPKLFFATMTEYEKDLPVKIIFPPEEIKICLAKVLSEAGLKQLHIAETEKYAHVTFFFNGMKEEEFPGEDRIIVPSPHVASYDQKPEMSAKIITEKIIKEIMSQKYDFMVVNFANADMVGHTGKYEPTVRAAEMVDKCLGQIADVILPMGGVLAITADHGNAEEVFNLQTGEIDKEHSTNPVPLILAGKDLKNNMAESQAAGTDLSLMPPVGVLADVAPTILKIMEIKQPGEMTGTALI
ncbi:2,3-bisphosphoglycerate-independent phosphoglycerate mutase [Candidatus Falkowbacteria bacterium]|nr:2,3-bisphosphoglycerate-independent phosphoglycerate mutase [Candidatus Falkowbacteria bacterium]